MEITRVLTKRQQLVNARRNGRAVLRMRNDLGSAVRLRGAAPTPDCRDSVYYGSGAEYQHGGTK